MPDSRARPLPTVLPKALMTDASLPSFPDDSQERDLTPMQQAFVDEYVSNGGKGKAAAEAAGFSPNSAGQQSAQLLKKPHVIKAVLNATNQQLARMAPGALARIGALSEGAKSEYVKLQANQDVLDRLGFKAPDKVDVQVSGDLSVRIDLA